MSFGPVQSPGNDLKSFLSQFFGSCTTGTKITPCPSPPFVFPHRSASFWQRWLPQIGYSTVSIVIRLSVFVLQSFLCRFKWKHTPIRIGKHEGVYSYQTSLFRMSRMGFHAPLPYPRYSRLLCFCITYATTYSIYSVAFCPASGIIIPAVSCPLFMVARMLWWATWD